MTTKQLHLYAVHTEFPLPRTSVDRLLGHLDVAPAHRVVPAPDHVDGEVARAGRVLGGSIQSTDSWAPRGICNRADPDALFVTGAAQRDAAKVCAGCPVKTECLAEALDTRVEYGVWGGMTERQRRALLKRAPDVTSWRAVLEAARDDALRATAG